MADLHPRAPIRRFDVFAEYNRLKGIKDKHLSPGKAKGYGLWLAKVVAAQKFGRMARPKPGEKRAEEEEKKEARAWHDLSGVPQTDKLFDKEIVNRMGREFYAEVFSPAIREAYEEGKSYADIRDSLRAGWKPEKVKSA
ncbi:MAG: hypothetical protein M1570_08630 [Chloroflexi bacterium]|nr:hypothetical protein [Chloroflexota bacterium]